MTIEIQPVPKTIAIEDEGGGFTIYDLGTQEMITYRRKDLTGLDMITAHNLCHELDLLDTPVWRKQESSR